MQTKGKSTIGKYLAKLCGCRFDEELGDVLRDKPNLVPSGHLHGGGTSTTDNADVKSWDDTIYWAECQRDEQSTRENCFRVVESWHIQNAAWCQMRQSQNLERGEKKVDDGKLESLTSSTNVLGRYYDAIAKFQKTSDVLMVHLKLDSATKIMERRKMYASARQRLPFQDEEEECKNVYVSLQNKAFYKNISKSCEIPCLLVDNSFDGQEAMNQTIKKILLFIHRQMYRRVQT